MMLVDQSALRDTNQPSDGAIGYSPCRPGVQGDQDRLLHGVFGVGELLAPS